MCFIMSSKILLFIYFVGISQAVFVDPHNDFRTSSLSDEDYNKGWNVVKMFHPPASQYKIEEHVYPKYEFEYAVSDENTGDHKHHHETRDGDRVRGEYSLVEPDGSLRKVEYNADDHSGFKAIVSKSIHKHGAHAVSVFGHTRHFYPVGHGVKINQYFPGKDYYHTYSEKATEEVNQKESKPVQEIGQDVEVKNSFSANDEPKTVLIETENKVAQTETENVKQPVEDTQTPIGNADLTKSVVVNVVPAVVTTMTNEAGAKETVAAVTNDKLIKESPTVEKTQINEDEKQKTDDSYHDSETASSYSHSRFYYAFK